MPSAPESASSEASSARPSLSACLLAAVLGFAAGDGLREPSKQSLGRAAVAVLDLYRTTASPLLARTGLVRCRFQPSCSAYGREAILLHGFPRGSLLVARRLLRCNPFTKGGRDPVPRRR
jgi:uncharacterized protein